MKVGLGSYAFRWSIGIGDYRPERPMRPVELLEVVAAAGAEVLQFADNLPLEQASNSEIADLARAAQETGVALQLGTNTLEAEHLDLQAGLAEKLNARLIRIAPSEADMRRAPEELVHRLREAGELFARRDCVLALENHFLLAPATLADLVARTAHPYVAVCLDVANSLANGEWPEQTITTLAPHAGNLHLKDYRIALDPHGVGMHIVGTPLGEGRMNLALALDAVLGRERPVDVIVEHWLPRAVFTSHEEARALEVDWSARGVTTARQALRERLGAASDQGVAR